MLQCSGYRGIVDAPTHRAGYTWHGGLYCQEPVEASHALRFPSLVCHIRSQAGALRFITSRNAQHQCQSTPMGGCTRAQVVAECLEIFQERRLDELLSFVPHAVIDRCLKRQEQRCAEITVIGIISGCEPQPEITCPPEHSL